MILTRSGLITSPAKHALRAPVLIDLIGLVTTPLQPYPMDERQWLLATSYNTGAECLHGSMLDEAKRWFEASTVICRFVPGGKDRAEKISETYTHLLSRYAPK